MKKGKTIDEIFDNFIPAKERAWYPWTWPEKDWWEKTERDDPAEVKGFINQVKDYVIKDYFFFCEEIMRDATDFHLHIGLHDELCHLVQYADDIVILMPRGHLKTTLSTVNYTLWKLAQNTNSKFLLASETEPISIRFLFEIRQHILKNKRLNIIFPNLKPAESNLQSRYERWSNQEIIVERSKTSKDPSVTSVGSLQTLTGTHYEFGIYDDIITAKNAKHEDAILKIIDWYEESLPLLNPGARKLIIGTKKHDADLYGHLEEQGNIPIYLRRVKENGKYIWPRKEVIEYVEKMKIELSPTLFSREYMNEAVDEESQEFKADWMNWWDADDVRGWYANDNPPDNDMELINSWIGTLQVFMGCDPNRTVKKRSDYTTIMAVGVDKYKRIIVLDYFRQKLSGKRIKDEFIKWLLKWNPRVAKIEVAGGDEHQYHWIREALKEKHLPYNHVKRFETSRQVSKEDRIRQMQPQFEGLNVWLKKGMVELETELLRFPMGKHDDLIDVLAYIIIQAIKFRKEVKKKDVYQGYRNRFVSNRGSWLTA